MWQLIIVTSVCSRTTNDLEEKCWAAPSPPLVYPTPRQGHSTSTPAKWEKWKKRNENESPKLYDVGNRRTELPSHGNGQADIPISLCCLLGAHQTLQSHFLVRLREMLRIPRSVCFSNVSCSFFFFFAKNISTLVVVFTFEQKCFVSLKSSGDILLPRFP